MSEHHAIVSWSRKGARFTDNRYSRVHQWVFDGGAEVTASASPHIVPLPMSSAEAVDPEEAYVAALSSCHMLFFLSIAAKRGLTVDSYVDRASGKLEKDGSGKLAITRVVLRPEVRFDGAEPQEQLLEEIHHEAHEQCFLARSVRSEIVIASVRPGEA